MEEEWSDEIGSERYVDPRIYTSEKSGSSALEAYDKETLDLRAQEERLCNVWQVTKGRTASLLPAIQCRLSDGLVKKARISQNKVSSEGIDWPLKWHLQSLPQVNEPFVLFLTHQRVNTVKYAP